MHRPGLTKLPWETISPACSAGGAGEVALVQFARCYSEETASQLQVNSCLSGMADFLGASWVTRCSEGSLGLILLFDFPSPTENSL